MTGTPTITADAQTATTNSLEAIGSAFSSIDETLTRIAMFNSLLATADRLQLEGTAFEGFKEVLCDIEDCLMRAVRILAPSFSQWQAEKGSDRWDDPRQSECADLG